MMPVIRIANHPTARLCHAATAGLPLPQFEAYFHTGTMPAETTFTRATGAGYWNASGDWTVAAVNAPRFEHDPASHNLIGLLLEEGRTNYVRNNTMTGAVTGTLGSGGALPSGWSVASGQGTLNLTVSGTGTSRGMEYLDLRMHGTASTSSLRLQLESYGGTAAANQHWTLSCYLHLIAGSLSNIGAIKAVMLRDGDAGLATGSDVSALIGGALPYRAQVVGFTPSGTTYTRPFLDIDLTAGLAVDMTLRLLLPQLERGGFATSAIKSSGSATARSGDVFSYTPAAGFNTAEGTLVASGITLGLITTGNTTSSLVSLNDGTTSQRIILRGNRNDSTFGASITNGGTSQAAIGSAPWAAQTLLSGAVAWKTDDFGFSASGGAVSTDSSGTVPVFTKMDFGRTVGSSDYFNGHLKHVALYRQRLDNTTLQALGQPL